jgi:hypothetical protein
MWAFVVVVVVVVVGLLLFILLNKKKQFNFCRISATLFLNYIAHRTLHVFQHGRRPIVQVIRHDAIFRVKYVFARERFSHAHFGHPMFGVVGNVNVSHVALIFSQCIAHGCRGGRYFPTGAMRGKWMLSRFDLRVGPAVQAFQIHAREIGVFAIQIVPLADSARLARDVRANELLAGASNRLF